MGAKSTRILVVHPTEVPCFLSDLRLTIKTAKPLCVGSIPTRASKIYRAKKDAQSSFFLCDHGGPPAMPRTHDPPSCLPRPKPSPPSRASPRPPRSRRSPAAPAVATPPHTDSNFPSKYTSPPIV